MNVQHVDSSARARKTTVARPDLSGFLVPDKNELPWILADLWSEAQDAIEAQEKADAAAAIAKAAADAKAKEEAEEAAKVKAAASSRRRRPRSPRPSSSAATRAAGPGCSPSGHSGAATSRSAARTVCGRTSPGS